VQEYLVTIEIIEYTEEDLRSIFRNKILRDKVFEVITADSKAEADQVWARHILVPDKAMAYIVLERLEAGEDWTALAAGLSQDTANKDTGGDLGWFGLAQMDPEFEKVAFNLSVGSTSNEPVYTQYGYHIIQVLGHEIRPLTNAQFSTVLQGDFNNWLSTSKSDENSVTRFEEVWTERVPDKPGLADFFQPQGPQP